MALKYILMGCVMLTLSLSPLVHAQGWYAEVELDFNHDLYAYENIARATLTFSGVTVSGSSSTSKLNLVVKGTNAISGDINLSINGLAWQPYDPMDPFSTPISARFVGKYNVSCQTGFFEQAGDTPLQQVYIWIRIYPRLQISSFVQLCDQITLTSNTCSPSYRWEVSDSSTGNFKTLSGKSTSSITVTRQELVDLAFVNPYGRKYFRVSGQPNTTSQLQAVDVYYPGPAASFTSFTPKCHDGADGAISLTITSPLPSIIDDYVVTLFRDIPPANQLQQDFINNGSQKIFNGLASGNYWVRIENNTNKDVYGNCWTDYLAGTIGNPEPVTFTTKVSDHNGYSVTCSGSRDASVEISPSGGSGTYTNFKWLPQVSTSGVAANLSAGDYQVTVTDSYGCSSETTTIVISEPDKLSVDLLSTGGKNGYAVSCEGTRDGMIEAQVAGGVPNYSYYWSTGVTTAHIKDLRPGEYSVVIEDMNGCATQAAIALKAPEPIDFTMSEINGINCPGDQTGVLQIASTRNTIGDIFYLWSSGEKIKEIVGKSSGTYSATVSDSQGCSTTKQYVLTEPLPYSSSIIPISDFNGTPVRCSGEANGELQAIVRDPSGSPASGQYYTWYRNGVVYQTGNEVSTLREINAGSYKVEIHYTAYCKTQASYIVQEPAPLTVVAEPVSNYNGVAISCNGASDGSIRAKTSGGTGAISFTWDGERTGPELTGLGKGTYTVLAKDANGCEARTQTVLNEPEPVAADIAVLSDFNGKPLSCWDASDARLGASAKGGVFPYEYTWNNGQTTAEIFDVPKGEYTLTAVDANGCVDIVKSTVVAPLQLKVSIVGASHYNGYGVSCNGAADGFLQAEASGGTGNHKFQWQGSKATSPLFTNLAVGTYAIVATDANGCTSSAEGVITSPPKLVTRALDVRHVACYGGTDGEIQLEAEGGAGRYTYSTSGIEWQSEARLAHLQSGTHQPRVRDANGCTATTSVTLTQPEKIVIDFENVEPALCGDPRGEASAVVSGGTGDYTYVWYDSEKKVVGEGPAVTGLRAGIFSVNVRDGHDCEARNFTSITSTDGPAVKVTEIHPASCSYTEDGSARLTVTAGNGPFTFRWQDGQSSSQAINLRKGTHFVEITDVNDCSVVESVNIPAPEELTVDVVEIIQPRCNGDCNGQITVQGRGGNGNYEYMWEDFMGPTVSNLCAGEYKVIAKDGNACITSHLINLTDPAPLALIGLYQQAPSCPETCDGALEIQVTGGTGDLTLEWLDGRTDPMLKGVCNGTYTATVKDTRNCSATASFTLESPEITSTDLGGTVTLCKGQTHTLDAGAGWKHQVWSGNNGFHSSARVVTLADAGIYSLEATTVEDCIVRDTFFLETSTDLLHATFLLTSEAYVNDTIVMIDISWPMPEAVEWRLPESMKQFEGSTDIVVGQFGTPGEYEISLVATLGECRDELTKTITILDNQDHLDDAGRVISKDFVKRFTLYPNPNDGMFDVAVEFAEESPAVLTIWNILTSRKIAQLHLTGKSTYEQHIDLRPLSAGSYSLRLDHNRGTEYIRFIVR